MTGFLPLDKVKDCNRKCDHRVPVNLGRTAGKTGLEALRPEAPPTTRRGGIPEVAAGRAHIVDEPSLKPLPTPCEN